MVEKNDVLKICKECLPYVDFEKEKDMVNDGVIDSLSLMKLIGELSFEFDVFFDVESLSSENFANVEAITSLINSLKG